MASKANPIAGDSHQNSLPPKRVAIVGAGVAGLAASWALNEFSNHEIVLFEANDYVGGHTNTVTFERNGSTTPVDSGFIVNSSSTKN